MSLVHREGARPTVNASGPAGDVVTRSAVELTALMRSGELSPVEVADAFLARAQHAQQALNPFTFVFAEEARAAALRSEQRLREDPDGCGALEGLPVAIKELTPVAGQPHTLASLAFKDHMAEVTDPAVQRLLAAGGMIHARTNTPEFGCASVTDNLLFGETLNPWDPSRGTAGSSGGAAAALAAHATPLAQGTDAAGSLRLPAAACGIVGMKPSHGVVPMRTPGYLETCNHNGPMARDVADLRLMFDVMAGPDPAQLSGVRPVDDVTTRVDLRGIRIGLIDAMGDLDVDADVVAHLHASARLLEQAGAVVEQVQFPWSYGRLFDVAKRVFAQYYGPLVRQAVEAGSELTDYALAFSESMVDLTDDWRVRLHAREEAAALHRRLGELFARSDFLLLPTLAAPAYPAGDHFVDHGPVVEGREQPDRWIVGFTIPFNLTSACPVVSVPTGLSRDGLPTAAQVVARPFHDYSAISVAEQLEQMLDR
ncbi:amidase [Geodermatophilus sp. DF01-2]|uniref:amidase n=1 Tax=Geodermatophilus sp. DF01-2 TaxID=2559610 RepID=UPI001073B879|nr:amidase [Geodermatophilus sp. DF01_2]TFV59831.1 amidase [Geodermatophilus sp. DF01_2]